ncbi:Metallo-hydrolase/oxidoreductase [Meredithblackwellia eburnea MCA 4105]
MNQPGNIFFRTAGFTLAVLVVGPAAYVSYCEVVRHHIMRKRRKEFELRREGRAARQRARRIGRERKVEVPEEEETLIDWAEAQEPQKIEGEEEVLDRQDREEEKEDLRQLFASVTVGGRFANPFPEWREQIGAWEVVLWKIMSVGRLFRTDKQSSLEELERSLPSEEPNWKLLFGIEPHSPGSSSSRGSSGSLEDDLRASKLMTMADSWDHLSQPSSGSGHLTPTVPDAVMISDSTESPSPVHMPPPPPVRVSQNLTYTWIGQSTNFVQLDQVGILTDPVFSYKTIDTFLAPPRLLPVPCPLSSLLSIQIVLVSHNHFDHVSPEVVLSLGSSVRWIVAKGIGRWLRNLGVAPEQITEMDWWEETDVQVNVPAGDGKLEEKTLKVACVGAMHWSARTLFDTNQSLWASFVVKGEKDSYFHCGDSGYSEGLYSAIGDLHGPITLSSLPIGAYKPRWHLTPVHFSPEDAVRAHLAIRSEFSVGVHHSTWCLSDEHYTDPPKDLEIAKKEAGLAADAFVVVPQGRTLIVG